MNKPMPNNFGEPLVVAFVLTWNDTSMTSKCIESLFKSSYRNLKIMLVDNGSLPPVCPIVKEHFPEIIPVRLSKNFGFPGGCNRGIAKAIELEAKYIFLLNNDTIVEREAIRNLVDCMENDPKIGIASALLLNPGTPKTVQSYQGWIDKDKAIMNRPGAGDLLDNKYRKTVDSEFIPACAILIRSEMVEKVGGFDENLFFYWEDYDLCVRCTKAGWRIVVVGTAEVVHRCHQSTGTISPFVTYYSTRNRLICLFRYGRLHHIFKNSFIILRSFYWKIKANGFSNYACHIAFLKACLHFLVGIKGKKQRPCRQR